MQDFIDTIPTPNWLSEKQLSELKDAHFTGQFWPWVAGWIGVVVAVAAVVVMRMMGP